MDPEIQKQLEEVHALARDNHRLLRAVRRHQLLASFSGIIFWLFVLGSTGYLYQFYLKPLADKFSATNNPSSAGFLQTSSAEIQKLLNSGKVGQ